MTFHSLKTNSLNLMTFLSSKLFSCHLQHLLLLSIDLDLGCSDDGDGDALLCVHPGALDLQGHGVQRNPQNIVDTWQDNGSSSRDKCRRSTLNDNDDVISLLCYQILSSSYYFNNNSNRHHLEHSSYNKDFIWTSCHYSNIKTHLRISLIQIADCFRVKMEFNTLD